MVFLFCPEVLPGLLPDESVESFLGLCSDQFILLLGSESLSPHREPAIVGPINGYGK
jgi:hypothetical protein